MRRAESVDCGAASYARGERLFVRRRLGAVVSQPRCDDDRSRGRQVRAERASPERRSAGRERGTTHGVRRPVAADLSSVSSARTSAGTAFIASVRAPRRAARRPGARRGTNVLSRRSSSSDSTSRFSGSRSASANRSARSRWASTRSRTRAAASVATATAGDAMVAFPARSCRRGARPASPARGSDADSTARSMSASCCAPVAPRPSASHGPRPSSANESTT